MTSRIKVGKQSEADILVKSRRRCCICFGLHGDDGLKKGQIAHLDGDPSNNDPGNLAFLCFDHHDEYDGKTSQAKGLTIEEVKRYRDELHNHVIPSAPRFLNSKHENLRPHRLIARNVLLRFVDLCLTYRTQQSMTHPDGTRDLIVALRHLKEEVEVLGPLTIPEFDHLYNEIRAKAWNFQRLLDHNGGRRPRLIAGDHDTVDERLEDIEEWFAETRDRIKALVDPYLTL